MSAWEIFRRSLRRREPSTPWLSPEDTYGSAGPDVLELMARDHMYALAERDKAQRQRDAFAVEVDELRRDRNLARSLVAASPEEAKRTCLDLSDRNAELRRERDRLERRVFELEGRAAKPDVIEGGRLP